MRLRRQPFALTVAVAALMLAAPTAAGPDRTEDAGTPQSRAERRFRERLDEASRREAEVLVDLADRAMAGREVESDFTLGWRHDFLKAQPGTFVPFTVTVEPPAGYAPQGLMYVRVARRDESSGGPPASGGKAGRTPRFAFDAIFPVELTPGSGGLRISRGFAVEPGDYDVFVALRERPADPLASRPGRLKAAVLKRQLTVPDFWTGELSASTVMLADRIDVLTGPIDPDEALERPYVIGQNDVHLAVDSTFRKDRELIVVFVIYNPTVTAGQGFDVRVDYHLFQRAAPAAGAAAAAPADAPPAREGERYVTRTDPQRFTPSTVAARLDPAAGHPLMAGQGILLSSFQEGEYRLGITITDMVSRRTLTRDVTFRVVGS